MKKQHLTLITLAAVLYHSAALVSDFEQCAINARRVRDNPSLPNLFRFLAADGALLRDLA